MPWEKARMLYSVLNKSWKWHLSKQQLYSHLLTFHLKNHPRQTRQAEYCWRCKDELVSNILLSISTHGHTSVDQSAKLNLISSVQTLYAIYRTYQERWLIWMDGERESRESMLLALLDDVGRINIVNRFVYNYYLYIK